MLTTTVQGRAKLALGKFYRSAIVLNLDIEKILRRSGAQFLQADSIFGGSEVHNFTIKLKTR
ncbi:hypothetical protein C8255_10525 [filamentous cyanobacterium CCP3]|nr:hypothetical protein C8255_10525 [filamentous cyanobacterium CCP3]